MIAPWLAALLLSQLSPTASPSPTPRPSGPVYAGNAAARLTVESRPLGVDPDGYAKWLVVARYLDAQGQPTKIMLNTDLDWIPDRGTTQWQPRMRFGQPAAIVRVNVNEPVRMRVRSNKPKFPDVYTSTDVRTWKGPRVVGASLGPYMNQIGWFPRETADVRIVRTGGGTRIITSLGAPSQTFRDDAVRPNTTYRYTIYREAKPPATVAVRSLPEIFGNTSRIASGKGMWLYYGTNPYDDHYIGHWNAQVYIDQAVRAGLQYVELRTAYGAYWEVDPQSKIVLDQIIDGLAAHNIGVIGWSVPRQATFEDLQASVRTASYRTAKGTRVTGIAVDFERGEEFMHDCPEGCTAMVDYAKRLRQALGPKVVVVATVEDPFLEHLDNSKYPYVQIARYADVLQPMSYWRMLSRKTMDVAKMNSELAGSYKKVLEVSGRALPVSMGGQTSNEGPLGSPPPQEITESLVQAKTLGAIGEAFFDWDGTSADQWSALGAYNW
ncbi:MAG: hypothetical protein GIW97_02270 [Candidatus Eremiobacteraeota bacterium]|nr:hypothetical protein [Candidatus Eremiobacteraeota bacterium]